jgi:hypothetical protein
MPWAVAASAAVGLLSAEQQRKSASKASSAQQQSAQQGIDEQRRQFDELRRLLEPYTQAGLPALKQQQALLGLEGPEAQQAAISAIENQPGFQSMIQQGENAMLQNASATGGLRGGNLQGAMAQFRPQMLAQAIQDQYSRLGGMTTLGQQSAAGVGSAGMQTGRGISDLLGQMGAARAGGILAQGKAQQQMLNALMQGAGSAYGSGGFDLSSFGSSSPGFTSMLMGGGSF